jgi:hypothetical protein
LHLQMLHPSIEIVQGDLSSVGVRDAIQRSVP